MKKKLLKLFLVLGSFLILIIAGGLIWFTISFPKVGPAADIQVEITPERVERGAYLANHVTLCMDCHGQRAWDKFAGPPMKGSEGTGGEHFNEQMGFPGDIVSPNITPFALKDWTDGEIYRALVAGVSRDGRALFPVMPYPHIGKMDKEDVYSIIAYIRNLPPVETNHPANRLNFPFNLIVKTMPGETIHEAIPAKSDKVAYGAYMTNAAGCFDCHTKQEKGKFIGEPFAGGMEFKMPGGTILRSPNITPHATGIGNMTEAAFIQRFKAYGEGYTPATVAAGEFQTVMPWTMYAGMEETDLSAIYAYLRSLEAVDNKVVRFEKTAR